MNRKVYIIWFIVYIILQWPWIGSIFGFCSLPELIVVMVLNAVLLSNALGIITIIFISNESIPDLWLYFFNEGQWLSKHGHSIGTPGFGFDSIFWANDVMPMLFAILIIINLIISAKRCIYIGKSVWWSLVPSYNPIRLFFK